jgi:hypothetical protein
MLAFLEARGRSRRLPWLLAGGLMGLAALHKESALALILPVLAIQIIDVVVSPRVRRTKLLRCALFWSVAAAGPLLYYSFVLDSGFMEIFQNLRQHTESMTILEGHLARGFAGAARTLWLAFGGVGLLALAGAYVVVRIRTLRPAAAIAGCWLLGGCVAFALPYYYPRFLAEMIPPMAWLAAAAVTAPFLRRPPRPMSHA